MLSLTKLRRTKLVLSTE